MTGEGTGTMSDETTALLLKLAQAAAVFLIGLLVIKIVLVITRKAMKKSDQVDPLLYKFIGNAVKVVLLIVLIMMTLDKLGVNSSGLVAVLGVGGGAVALAMKDSLGNVAGGIMTIFTKPFSAGDYVDIDGTTGSVQHMDLLITTLKTPDNKVVTIPNGKVNTAVITNYSRLDTRRVDFLVGISRDEDADKVIKMLLGLAEKTGMVLSDPAPFCGIKGQSEGALELEFFVWTKTSLYWDVKYHLEDEIRKALAEEKIKLPRAYVNVSEMEEDQNG